MAVALALCVAESTPAFAQQNSTDNSDSSDNGDSPVIKYLFDRPSKWTENPITTLPALPQPANLVPFEVSSNSPLTFMVDWKSVSVGTDGVVRYTVVITSPEGARNVRYEGIHCDTYEWRLYSGANDAGTDWDHASTDWDRIESSSLNAYHAALYTDYFCTSRSPSGSAKTIVSNLRSHRTLNYNTNGR